MKKRFEKTASILTIVIFIFIGFGSQDDEISAINYCDVLINELNKHSEDYDSELWNTAERYYETLTPTEQQLWIEEGQACYDEYLFDYGEE